MTIYEASGESRVKVESIFKPGRGILLPGGLVTYLCLIQPTANGLLLSVSILRAIRHDMHTKYITCNHHPRSSDALLIRLLLWLLCLIGFLDIRYKGRGGFYCTTWNYKAMLAIVSWRILSW